jgi:hypothetical protein
MVHYNAVYARPAQRWTFHSIGIWRSHEHYFNIDSPAVMRRSDRIRALVG